MTPHSLLAVDPGNERTGYALFGSDKTLLEHGDVTNFRFVDRYLLWLPELAQVACEFPFPRGERVPWQLFYTAKFAGRLELMADQARVPFYLANRKDVKLHLTGKTTTNDVDVKRAVIAHYGGEEKAVGGKKCPACRGRGHFGSKQDPTPPCYRCVAGKLPAGPLHGVTGDAWAAVAVGLTYLAGACQTTESREQQRVDKRADVTARMATHRRLKAEIPELVRSLRSVDPACVPAILNPDGTIIAKALAARLGVKPALITKAVRALEKKDPNFLAAR